jgi:1,6-anhydro-N-acetylmuramate kinase
MPGYAAADDATGDMPPRVRGECAGGSRADQVLSGIGPNRLGQLAVIELLPFHGSIPDSKIATSADYGVDVDAKEAVAFAILANRTWRRQPSNLPSATGARRPVILGKISY